MRDFTVLAVVFVLLAAGAASGETVYFLVAEANTPVHGDSYVLPLTEPNDIDHARDLIKYGPAAGQPIVIAQIICASDCINRDYLDPNKYFWSWHVMQFVSFVNTTGVILDGWPGLVEDDCAEWVADTGGLIGFWDYTVTAELGADPKHWNRDFDGDTDVDFIDYALAADFDLDSLVELKIFAEAWLSPYAAEPTLYPLWFDCWNWPYQCYGDADNKTETLLKYRVYLGDLKIIEGVAQSGCGWPCYYPDPNYDPCADFNRDFTIYNEDVDILEAHWRMRDSDFVSTCPTCP